MFIKKTILLLPLCLCLLTACSSEVTVDSLAAANSNKQFKVNTLESINTSEAPDVSIAEDNNDEEYPSFTAASADKTNTNDKIFTLQALAVQKNDVSDYERRSGTSNWNSAKIKQVVTLAQATEPVLSLSLNADGYIAAATIYFADKTYQSVTTNGPISESALIGTIGEGATANATTTMIMADRKNIFGLIDGDGNSITSDYMVYVGWNMAKEFHSLASTGTQDSIFEDDGVMVAGIETDNSDIPPIGEASFNGKGRGEYGDKRTSYTTIFDVSAKVNFASSITISSSNTMRCEDNSSQFSECTQMPEATLDFSGATTNLIRELRGSIEATDLFGGFNARFYGPTAEELGGTFAMVSSGGDRYYYGAFGGKRGNIFIAGANQFAIASLINRVTDSQKSADNASYSSLTAASDGASGTELTLKGLAIHKDDSKTHNRVNMGTAWDNANINQQVSLTRASSPLLSLSFNATKNIETLTAYFADKTYIADISGGTSSAFALSGVIGSTSAEVPADATTKLMADRSKDIFGYNLTANYMLYVDWVVEKTLVDEGLTQSSFRNHGVMIAGMETNAVIPTTGTLVFEGKGRGFYGDLNNIYATIFNMIANVDFVTATIDLQTLSTVSCTSENISTCTVPASALDFSANDLSFDNGSGTAINVITDNMVATNNLTGTIDARFYGGDFEEFGGTFTLTNSNSYYYGAFGGYNFGFPNIAISRTTNDDLGGYQSFDDASDAADTANADKTIILPAVAVSYATDGTTTDPSRFAETGDTSPAIKLTFDMNGDISAATTYVASQSIDIIMPTTPLDSEKVKGMVMVGADTSNLEFTRIADTTFSFSPEYMMIGWWETTNGSNSNSGSMVVGFETAGTGIDSILTEGNANFTGNSSGFYHSASNNFLTKSNITVNVDFTKRIVGVTSDTTQCNDTATICNAAVAASITMSDLDFNTADAIAPKYDAGTNNISGAIITTGTDVASRLKGKFDARFYGKNAAELGGTFIMQSADEDKFYRGAFITKR